MKRADLLGWFYRYFNEDYSAGATKGSISEANALEYLNEAYADVCNEFELYIKTKAVVISELTNKLTRSQILPTLATGESAEHIFSVQFQRGTVGSVASVADDTEAVFTDVDHGLAAGDVIEVYEATNYTNTRYTVAEAITDNTFSLYTYGTTTKVVYAGDDTLIWIKSDQYQRQMMMETQWDFVQSLVWNSIVPSGGENPAGMLFVNWVCMPGDLPTDAPTEPELTQTIIPRYLQRYIALRAAILAGVVLGDDFMADLTKWENRLGAMAEQNKPEQPPDVWGLSNKLGYGVWAYRNVADYSFIFRPGWCYA